MNRLERGAVNRAGAAALVTLDDGREAASVGRGHGVAEMGLALSIARDGFSKGLKSEDTLESRVAIEAFLRDVETRAFRIALMSIRDRDEALDIVQDSMIRLVRRYSSRPSDEWRPLFYRILQNRIRDVQRRRTVRSRVLELFRRRRGR